MSNTLGLSLRTYQRIETCQSPIDIDLIYKICDSYDIPFNTLVNPEIQPNEIEGVKFFRDLNAFKEEDFLKNRTHLLEHKDHFFSFIRKDPVKMGHITSLPEFENASDPLFVSSLNFTIGNAKARAAAGMSDDKFRGIRTFKDPSLMIKTWDAALKYQFPAYKMLADHQIDNKPQFKTLKYNFVDFGKEEKGHNCSDGPLVFGVIDFL